jgi:hypothetical protein
VVPSGSTGTDTVNYLFVLWCLEMVDYKAEHNMIEQEDKTRYKYNKYTYKNKGVITQGIYVNHKLSKHDA